MLDHPAIKFSPWVPWQDRETLADGQQYMGVYLWAHFHRKPDSTLVPSELSLPEELIYVGETKNLNARPLSGTRHHRLEHYDDTYPADRKYRYLYVSVFPVERYQDNARCRAIRAYTRYVEDLIYWRYVEAYGTRAALDYKKKPGRSTVAKCCATRA